LSDLFRQGRAQIIIKSAAVIVISALSFAILHLFEIVVRHSQSSPHGALATAAAYTDTCSIVPL
jgi:hypothetical protein